MARCQETRSSARKFTRERTAAKKLAAEYFDRFPKNRYQTEVESWRHLQSQNIEFTMKRYASRPLSPGATQHSLPSGRYPKAPILFVAAAVCREAGFCHEDLFMSVRPCRRVALLAWPGPTQMVVLETHLRRAASSRLEMLNWWNERQVRNAKWPFGVIGNPQINFKQISTPVRYHPHII